MSRRSLMSSAQRHLRILGALTLAFATVFLNLNTASAATLTSASVGLSDPRPSGTGVTYDVLVSGLTNANIKCIKETFATTSTGSTKPTSMVTASGISIGSQDLLASTTGWTRGGSDADGTVTWTHATGASPASTNTRHWALTGFQNSSTPDTALYLQFSTYDNVDCSTTPRDNVTMGFILTNGSTVSLTVDPTLTFTVNGLASGTSSCANVSSTVTTTATTIPFGNVTTASNAVACQDLAVATNSTHGYTVYLRYTGALTNANGDTFTNIGGSNSSPGSFSSPGTEAYGYSTNDNSLQAATTTRFAANGTSFAPASTTNEEVAYSGTGVSSQTTRIAHQAGISSTTKPGTYQSTIIYTCTPVY